MNTLFLIIFVISFIFYTFDSIIDCMVIFYKKATKDAVEIFKSNVDTPEKMKKYVISNAIKDLFTNIFALAVIAIFICALINVK